LSSFSCLRGEGKVPPRERCLQRRGTSDDRRSSFRLDESPNRSARGEYNLRRAGKKKKKKKAPPEKQGTRQITFYPAERKNDTYADRKKKGESLSGQEIEDASAIMFCAGRGKERHTGGGREREILKSKTINKGEGREPISARSVDRTHRSSSRNAIAGEKTLLETALKKECTRNKKTFRREGAQKPMKEDQYREVYQKGRHAQTACIKVSDDY